MKPSQGEAATSPAIFSASGSPEASACPYTVTEIVEQRHAVRLGPHTDCARSDNVVVVRLDVLLAVQAHAHLRPGEIHAQRMPRVARYRRIDVLDGVAPSVRRVIQRHVVLERVGARDV